ncbi:hypothetical protein [Nocardia sp. NPDC059239]|uniref:hypothetical protein n=1 Tax=unclassified Nocardia TaxID=2637762 RepID=UPI00367A5F60
MANRTTRLEPVNDLDAALRTISEFNRILIAADTKVGLLLTANGFALMGLVSSHPKPVNLAIYMTATALELSLIVCMGYLAATLRPNLRSSGAGNWFGFPTFPAEAGKRPAAPELADYAWRQAAALAEIAQRKYRRFGVALRWSVISLIIFLIWYTVVLLGTAA